MTSQRGIALVLVILVVSFLSAIGLGLALMVVMDRLATGNLRGSVALLYAADSALELAVRDLARLEDWNLALSGAARSAFADGEPYGVRAIPGGGVFDLTVSTNHLNCARATECTVEQMSASSRDRPWGQNNPRWRLFAYGPLAQMAPLARPAAAYLAVWVGDDGREGDGDPLADAAPDEPGHGRLRLRVTAVGPFGARRAIEAELARLCLRPETPCGEGVRVQSWQELRESVP